ncbi:hypothetical protein BMS97_10775 [Leuconostoc mesenteroides subsp. mesenteroides]|uniref:hypothetical protein n=1 Tax=Leuconostoc mesenteroides TaxID=1245 RepID=UPI000A02C791|nr:hypothetical protein [Leuconostoc mesenteroides]ORI88081.1 hypothetical protein BMS97_10775 [Leuconostoc mesenteroides subsp. mesenteroides]
MSLIIELFLIIIVGSLQWYTGIKRNILLGSILPILSIIGFLYLLMNGQINFSIRDIIAPILLVFGLFAIYFDGEHRSNNKK